MGQVEPTLKEIESRTGETPEEYLLADGGYAKQETVEDLTGDGIDFLAPPPIRPATKIAAPTSRERATVSPSPSGVSAWVRRRPRRSTRSERQRSKRSLATGRRGED
jgi:hypothetical protein